MKHQPMTFLVLAGAISLTAACGPSKKLCEDKNPASFATFLDEEWRAYCADYRDHVEQPGRYEPTELVAFFGNHSTRVKELNKQLFTHDNFCVFFCAEGFVRRRSFNGLRNERALLQWIDRVARQ